MKNANQVASRVIGLSLAEALSDIQAAGCVARISSIGGLEQIVTTEMSFNRINLTVEDGWVASASVG